MKKDIKFYKKLLYFSVFLICLPFIIMPITVLISGLDFYMLFVYLGGVIWIGIILTMITSILYYNQWRIEKKKYKKTLENIYCKHCGRSIPTDINICPYCGKNYEQPS